jgi:hypothetical protein
MGWTTEKSGIHFWQGQEFLAYFPYFEKTKIGLRYRHAVCVSVYHPYQLLNGRTNLYKTWCLYHGT